MVIALLEYLTDWVTALLEYLDLARIVLKGEERHMPPVPPSPRSTAVLIKYINRTWMLL